MWLLKGRRLGLLGLAAACPVAAAAQQAAGTELWRLIGVTQPVPFALARGATGAFWNPAQRDSAGAEVGADVIQTPEAVGASGFIAVARTRTRGLGSVGLVYGRVSLTDLVRTTFSPDPDGAPIPFYTQSIGLTWSASPGFATVGATVGYHETRLDQNDVHRFTIDVGVARQFGDAVRLAAATHLFSGLRSADAAQDIYAGAEWRLWHGPLWQGGGAAAVRARYGLTVGHSTGVDHTLGAGFDLGDAFGLDLQAVREESYGNTVWRGVGGVRVRIGRYRFTFSRDAGVNDLGSAYRVGLEARLQ
jgi:hypothetical protein